LEVEVSKIGRNRRLARAERGSAAVDVRKITNIGAGWGAKCPALAKGKLEGRSSSIADWYRNRQSINPPIS